MFPLLGDTEWSSSPRECETASLLGPTGKLWMQKSALIVLGRTELSRRVCVMTICHLSWKKFQSYKLRSTIWYSSTFHFYPIPPFCKIQCVFYYHWQETLKYWEFYSYYHYNSRPIFHNRHYINKDRKPFINLVLWYFLSSLWILCK